MGLRSIATIVVVLVIASGCGKRTRKVGPGPDSVPEPFRSDEGGAKLLNPLDPTGLAIVANDEKCTVAKRFRGSNEPERQVDCPPEMDDPAWDHCGGELYSIAGQCFCVPLQCLKRHCKILSVKSPCPK
ncbi:MAG: hypothetical protein HYV09_06005 [Deltaproteobacteria bacterium]|nr:hypothetical protein [Deltaproteobacteria bacterium]